MVYRVLIVDDEYYVRQRVRLCIPWQEHGFECVGEAGSVQAALDFLASHQVELVIADISMPGRDGLDLIQELHGRNDRVHFIILSGFSTFEYAKEAIKYNVSAYLLKPIDTEELVCALSGIRQKLDAQTNADAELLEFHHIRERAETVDRGAFFRELFAGRDPAAENAGFHGFSPGRRHLLYIVDFRERDYQSFTQNRSLKVALQNTVLDLLQDHDGTFLCEDFNGHQVFSSWLIPEPLLRGEIIPSVEDRISESADCRLIIGYREVAENDAAHIQAAYRHAMDFFCFRSVYELPLEHSCAGELPWAEAMKQLQSHIAQLQLMLNAGDHEGVEHGLASVFGLLRSERFPLRDLESALYSLHSVALQYTVRHVQEDRGLAGSTVGERSYAEMLQSGCTLGDMENRFLALFRSLLTRHDSADLPYIHALTDQAAEMIHSGFSRPEIGLSVIAATLMISPSYLSRNFKKHHGVTITQYITNCRIEHAKTLLLKSGLSVSHIAHNVGFQDFFYFSKLFKKNTGMSPSQFRKEHKADDT